MMSERITYSFPSLINPIAIPETGALIGTPASIRAREAPQTVAIEDEPFDSVISETIRVVYEKFSAAPGKIGFKARQANLP